MGKSIDSTKQLPKLTLEKEQMLIRLCIWDYKYNHNEIMTIVKDDAPANGMFTASWIFRRMLETLSWYDILALLPLERIKALYTKELVQGIWPKQRQESLEYLRKILFNEPIPNAKWSDEMRQRLKASVFSNRWNSIEQVLLKSQV